MSSIKYEAMDDREIITYIQHGDKEAIDFLLNKYKNLVRAISQEYFIIGADKEDLIQEGMIGLYKAVRDFDPNKNVPFFGFAKLCITRNIITAIKLATRQKNQPLNNSLSLEQTLYEDETAFALETKDLNPEDQLIDKESKIYIEENMLHSLSQLEWRVLSLHLKGRTYQEIATILSKDEKAIDNAIQRSRKKIEKIILNKNLTERDRCDNI